MGGVSKSTEQPGRERGSVLVAFTVPRRNPPPPVIHYPEGTCALVDCGHDFAPLANGHVPVGGMS